MISTPSGGGALSGLGEKFSPDLHTGTGNFTVPLALPPGRNGFQPELSLVYSTGNGNGPFGLGWNLSVPGVSRKTSKGVPRYDDAEDTFILSGAEDLVPVAADGGETRYRPRTEGLFARITRHHDTENDYWEVRSKDGLRTFYGTRPSNRPEDADGTWQDPAVIAKPDERDKVFAWKLTETLDPFENRIVYEYERDSDVNELRSPNLPAPSGAEKEQHHWDQLYLKKIGYVNFADEATGEERFLVSVTFVYEDRPDPFSEYRSGFEIRTRRRCKRIEIRTHADTERPVRTYELIYLGERVAVGELSASVLPLNDVSLLSQVRVVGRDGAKTEELPPLEFGYTRFRPEERDFFPLEGDLPARSLSSPDLELADIFGNGLPDLVQIDGTVRYWRNLGGGRFDLPREMRSAPAGLGLADPGVQLVDADGDGRVDLLVTSAGLSGYFPLQHDGEWDRRAFRRYRQAPTFDLQNPEVQLVDLDGDGVTDAVRSGSRLEHFFNDPGEGFTRTRWVARKDVEAFPNVNFSDPRVKWADLTGDGLQDIALVHDGNVEYYPNLGHGDWGRRVHMKNSPRFPYGYDPRRILVGDVDGDGVADLVYVDHGKVTLWMNRSGNGWSEPIEIDGTPPLTDVDAVRLVDALGTGVRGVLWSRNLSGSARASAYFLDFTGGVKPYLLSEMDNHMGATTRVEYAPSTRFYLADRAARRPWKTTLPFPVQVVSRVEVIDEVSGGKLTTEYRYHHGYWDGVEREFRGFGMVEQLDTELFERYNAPGLHGSGARFGRVDAPEHFSPPTLTKTWFHQGPVADVDGTWKEADYRDEYWPGDPPMLARSPEVEALLKALPRRQRRDALRTLRSRVLRTELYALDGTEHEDRPYTVTESQHGLCGVLADGSNVQLLCQVAALPTDWTTDATARRIFFPHALAQRTTQWERGDDPMTQFAFTSDYDAFGMAQTQVAIACPRRWPGLSHAQPEAEPFLGTVGRTVYATPTDADVYIHDRVAKATTYEIRHRGDQTLTDMRAAADEPTRLHVIGQSLSFYDGDTFTGLPLGEIGAHGALMRSESLVLTPEIVQEAYKSGDTIASPPEVPPYLDPNQAGDPSGWPAEYPEGWKQGLPSFAGFHLRTGDPDAEEGYFSITGRRAYDARGLVVTQRDPLGNDTRIAYDAFGLLPTKVTNAVGLTTTATYDYRVLQSTRIKDANGNEQAFGFSPLGLLREQYVRGKRGADGAVQEGDDQAPSLRLEYDFLAFTNSPEDNRQPVWVRSIRRIYHDTDADVPAGRGDETIETVEYSDGFGRLVQTRTQAEDVLYGDPVFANGVLPADQGNPATQNAVTGARNTDPGNPNVVVSGWQTYDNKGRVVEAYEPFFAQGWDYLSREEAGPNLFGQKVTHFYDPRGQVVRTVNPDSSEQRVIYGVPGIIAAPDLTNPDVFEPTPWEVYTYDAGDNAGRTHGQPAQAYSHYWNTPASIEIDALGRTVRAVERNRPHGAAPGDAPEEYVTRSTYDIQGNLLTVTDALGRLAFRYTYSLVPESAPLRIESIDAGLRRVVVDAAGREVERRDGKGALILQRYDALSRLTRLWARDNNDANAKVKLRQRLVYGDDRPQAEWGAARKDNLLGQLHHHYDEAGRVSVPRYGFKGNALETVRQVIKDKHLLAVFDGAETRDWQIEPFQVDWEAPAGISFSDHAASLLNPAEYRTSSTFDALGRVKTILYPEDVEGHRSELNPTYNRAGALERVELDGEVYVERIAYNAKGQRTLIAYGNGVMTRYAYELHTFRLARLRSERYGKLDVLTYQPDSQVLQDYGYDYDLAGNILLIRDRTPGSGVQDASLGQDALDRQFEYDAIYRLTSATGRECKSIPSPRPWHDEPRCGFNSPNHGSANQDNAPQLTARYQEAYAYDPAGNMLSMLHRSLGNGGAAWTRHFGMGGMTPDQWQAEWPVHLRTQEWTNPPGNQLTHLGDNDPITPQTHFYDANGNMTRETTSRHFEWNHSDQLKAFRTQAGQSEPSVHAQYLYDASGQRVVKLVRKQNGPYEVRVYIGGLFEHYRWGQNTSAAEQNNRLHVMDDQQRIALVRRKIAHPKDQGPAVQLHLGDYLGSSSMVVDDSGGFINKEEYYPYGESSFGSFAKKRFRFAGKERDEESGLQYYGSRYLIHAFARWVNCDPSGPSDGINLYRYTINNPIRYVDVRGLQAEDSATWLQKIRNWRRARVLKAFLDRASDYLEPNKPEEPNPVHEHTEHESKSKERKKLGSQYEDKGDRMRRRAREITDSLMAKQKEGDLAEGTGKKSKSGIKKSGAGGAGSGRGAGSSGVSAAGLDIMFRVFAYDQYHVPINRWTNEDVRKVVMDYDMLSAVMDIVGGGTLQNTLTPLPFNDIEIRMPSQEEAYAAGVSLETLLKMRVAEGTLIGVKRGKIDVGSQLVNDVILDVFGGPRNVDISNLSISDIKSAVQNRFLPN